MNTPTAVQTPDRIEPALSPRPPLRELAPGVSVPVAAWNDTSTAVLTPPVIELIASLHRRFNERRRELLAARVPRQAAVDAGALPDFENHNSEAAHGDWDVAPIPADLRVRRVEITGPVSSAKMVINMLSRNADGVRADTAMLDFEDSMKPSWRNVINGIHNVIGAVDGTLTFSTPEKTYRLTPDDMPVVMVRTRGLHLDESNVIIDGQPVSGGLFDLATTFFHTAQTLVRQGKTPTYYIPKTEHALEARWWNDLFVAVQEAVGLPRGTLRATFLIETLPAAFQIEEILFEFREHAAALNVGRWDKIFSDIKVLKNHPDRIMADRATITMQKPWMDAYAKRLIKICHERGAYAIGGMSAFTPGKTPELRQRQTAKVTADKGHEFSIGHDGCWVSHPYFITYALAEFKAEHQLDRMLPEVSRYPDILPRGEEPRSIDGLRTNVRVGIAYQQGWNNDIACVSWDGLMEDLATYEISRAQTWQWLHHGVTLADGRKVTPALVEQVFDEELARIVEEITADIGGGQPALLASTLASFRQAAADARATFLEPKLRDYFRQASDPVE
ncbi:malate synthase [Opitutus sp. ER46]|uniref:malate synthase n=1 Tax=Opitutus sp. ER46 TaxID=2161864 RepID=UPI000D31C182|nr:malate synthase [Opitutus sp. ER46]PTX91228.1 malate synthase A [Opitutus sp. ER46]